MAISVPLRAAAIDVEARVEPTLVGAGQFVTLVLEAKVEGGLNLDIEPHFSLENLEIVAGPSQSQQVSFVNGKVSRSQSLSWTLRALEVGTARVQNLRLSVNGEAFDMPEQVVEVQTDPVQQVDPYGRPRRPFDPFEDFFDPGRRRRGSSQAAEPKLFLRAEASPKNPFVGQQVLYSLVLFTQADIGAVSPDQMPDFEGLWSVDIEQPNRPRSVMTEVQGERYGKVVLLQKALFPIRPGKLRLDPVEARLVAKIPDYSWLGVVGTFDKEYSLASNAISLDVRPIPEGPEGFGGAVGDFEIEASLEPREIELGEAATLTLELSGKGHVEGLPEPELPPLEGVEVFPPQRDGGNRAVGTTVYGSRRWTYVLVPERADAWEIPIPRYSYFDPAKVEHRVTQEQSLVLIARDPGGAPRSQASTDDGDDVPAPLDRTQADAQPTATSGWKRWLPAIPLAVLFGFMVPLAKRSIERHQATRHLRQHLKDAADISKPRAAAQAIEEAWRGFLAERWSVPLTASPGEWPPTMSERGVADAVVAELSTLVDDLHYLRYAPELSAYTSLRSDLIERSLRLARSLG